MHEILEHVAKNGVVAILRGVAPPLIVPLGRALLAAGVGAVEVTLNSDGALDGITRLRRELGGAIPVGAGTVMDGAAARRAIAAGAMFLLAPHLAEDTLAAAIALGVPAVVGTMTPTEAVRAYSLGAEMVKVFPAGTLGANYFRELRGPLPHIRTMAVGGVNAGNAGDFIRAGAAAVGAGSQLVDQAAAARGDWEAVTRKAAELVAAVRAARTGG
jgi:2-dehydro-3-deoxyphosphogluconate aldolase/(4S)-4-hydroxy-2-oxoglutarate aldolase